MEEDNDWVPVMTTELPAPDAVIHLIKCGCIKSKCSTKQCQCRNADLSCTDMCSCSDNGNECINVQNVNVEETSNESESDHDDELDESWK